MRRVRLATIGGTLLLSLAACAGEPAPQWIVTETHHYPAHTNVTFTGTCPAAASTVTVLPTSCTRHDVTYPELYEVCAKRATERACWYVTRNQDYQWAYGEQHPGRPVQDFEDYIFIDQHPAPTNEWNQPS